MIVWNIFKACLVVGLTGAIIGALLTLASRLFAVKSDERIGLIREKLPGNNCGGCGYAGCDALAAAIAQGSAPATACPVGGSTAAAEIGLIMGVDAEVSRTAAFVHCSGNAAAAGVKYEYHGAKSCTQAIYVTGGGPKSCTYGCMGFGSCEAVCEFDAIQIKEGVAVVDRDRCTSCGKCVKICPKGLIEILPYDFKSAVACSSADFGKNVRAVCSVGCIGCKICEKNCPKEAVHIENNLAVIDSGKCTGCGLCREKCPQKIIVPPSFS